MGRQGYWLAAFICWLGAIAFLDVDGGRRVPLSGEAFQNAASDDAGPRLLYLPTESPPQAGMTHSGTPDGAPSRLHEPTLTFDVVSRPRATRFHRFLDARRSASRVVAARNLPLTT